VIGESNVSHDKERVQFGVFEVDLRAGELRRNGSRVKLQEQPFQILTLLLDRPGEVITREELRSELWPADTFVDFDHSLNAAVRRLRDALGDAAENPRFIETVARRGYRFVAPVDGARQEPARPAIRRRRWPIAIGIGMVLLAGVVIGFYAAKRISSSQRVQERRLTANPAEVPVLNAVISPDGNYLAFSDTTGFYLRQIDTGETHALSLPTGFKAEPKSWFPDSTHLVATVAAGLKNSYGIWEVSTMGGSPRKLADAGNSPAVSPDGRLITFTTESPSGQEIWIMQADGQNRRKLVGEADTGVGGFGPATWAPDSQKIAYVRFKYSTGMKQSDSQIEIASVRDGHTGIIVVDPNLGPALAWCGDGRLMYTLRERPPNQNDFNLWSARISDRTGHLMGAPVRITSEPGGIDRVSASFKGKRLALIRETLQRDVYVGELQANATKLSPPLRLTLDERQDFPYDWTPDSEAVFFTSDRDGVYHIFRQGIEQATAELVVGGNEDLIGPRLSPDRTWIIYLVMPKLGETSPTVRMMRVPVNGGPPQLILQGLEINNQQCAHLPSRLCLFSEITPGGEKIFSFDPMTGSTKEISVPKIADQEQLPYNWTLSSDGKILARALEKDSTIRFFFLESGTEQTVTLPAWASVTSIDWAADSKSVWGGACINTNKWAMLNIDLNGRVRTMLKDDNMVIGWAIPSPDGHRLALLKASGTSNVWMVEGF
jgi:DNA-binding winged helix-turn-helix (wHTH) protein/Tol biopolymer transport system component